jgi:mono/diheme cytochrome c family protein
MHAGRVALLSLVVGVAAAAEPSAGTAGPPATGSPRAGRDLFTGARGLRNGGAPCGACHALGGEGLAFTASLGPELSSSLATMDPEALDGLLETLPFPTMIPVYDGRALTSQERADLVAYLIPAAGKGPPTGAWHFEAVGALVAALLFLGLALARRRRKPPSRALLLARAANRQGGFR